MGAGFTGLHYFLKTELWEVCPLLVDRGCRLLLTSLPSVSSQRSLSPRVGLWPLLPTSPTDSSLGAPSLTGSAWPSCTPSASPPLSSRSATRQTRGEAALKGRTPQRQRGSRGAGGAGPARRPVTEGGESPPWQSSGQRWSQRPVLASGTARLTWVCDCLCISVLYQT